MAGYGSPNVRRRRLAAELRRLRERAGFIGEEVARLLGWSTSKISRLERAQTAIKRADLRRLLDLYRVARRTARVCWLSPRSRESRHRSMMRHRQLPAGYAAFVDAEAAAITRWDWEPQVVPGLLQTQNYARAVMRGWYSMFNLPPSELELRVEARIARQQVLSGDQPLVSPS